MPGICWEFCWSGKNYPRMNFFLSLDPGMGTGRGPTIPGIPGFSGMSAAVPIGSRSSPCSDPWIHGIQGKSHSHRIHGDLWFFILGYTRKIHGGSCGVYLDTPCAFPTLFPANCGSFFNLSMKIQNILMKGKDQTFRIWEERTNQTFGIWEQGMNKIFRIWE